MQITTPVLSEADRAELTRLEEDMWRSNMRFDLAFQESKFAPDFIEVGRSGRLYSRVQIISNDAQPIDAQLPLRDFCIRLLDETVAQIMYISQVTRGGEIEYARRTSIWSKTDNGWVMRFHQGTPFTP